MRFGSRVSARGPRRERVTHRNVPGWDQEIAQRGESRVECVAHLTVHRLSGTVAVHVSRVHFPCAWAWHGHSTFYGRPRAAARPVSQVSVQACSCLPSPRMTIFNSTTIELRIRRLVFWGVVFDLFVAVHTYMEFSKKFRMHLPLPILAKTVKLNLKFN